MFDPSMIADLDGAGTCAAVVDAVDRLWQVEAEQIYLAVHWADLHNQDTLPGRGGVGSVLPGMQRPKQLGGHGTPRVAEFCTGELGVLMGVGYISADNLIRDGLDLSHRHPLAWAAIAEGQVRVWQARRVAKAAHAAGLGLEQARWVDAATTRYLGSLPWSGSRTC
jgi:hypothetical protein